MQTPGYDGSQFPVGGTGEGTTATGGDAIGAPACGVSGHRAIVWLGQRSVKQATAVIVSNAFRL